MARPMPKVPPVTSAALPASNAPRLAAGFPVLAMLYLLYTPTLIPPSTNKTWPVM